MLTSVECLCLCAGSMRPWSPWRTPSLQRSPLHCRSGLSCGNSCMWWVPKTHITGDTDYSTRNAGTAPCSLSVFLYNIVIAVFEKLLAFMNLPIEDLFFSSEKQKRSFCECCYLGLIDEYQRALLSALSNDLSNSQAGEALTPECLYSHTHTHTDYEIWQSPLCKPVLRITKH